MASTRAVALLRRAGRRDARRRPPRSTTRARPGTSTSTRPGRAAPPACRSARRRRARGPRAGRLRSSTPRSHAAGASRRPPGGPTSPTRRTSTRRSSGWSATTRIPSVLPQAPAGPGYAEPQRLRRRIGLALAHAGYVEAPSYPFLGQADLDALGLPADDDRRHALRLANPLTDDEPLLRTTLLPGLLARAAPQRRPRQPRRRAVRDRARSFRPGPDPLPAAPRPPVDRRPTDDEVAALDAALPAQPLRVAAVLAGAPRAGRLVGTRPGRRLGGRRRGGADGRPAGAGRGRRCGPTSTRRGTRAAAPRCCATATGRRPRRRAAPPGRRRRSGCPSAPARWSSTSTLLGIGHDPGAGAAAVDVPAGDPGRRARRRRATCRPPRSRRRCAPAPATCWSRCGCSTSTAASRSGEGKASLAYALRFRAPDRTLTVEEATAAREAAVAEAAPAYRGGPARCLTSTGRSRSSPARAAASAATSRSAWPPTARGSRCWAAAGPALDAVLAEMSRAGGRGARRAGRRHPDRRRCGPPSTTSPGTSARSTCWSATRACARRPEATPWAGRPADWWRVIETNLRGPFLLAHAVLPVDGGPRARAGAARRQRDGSPAERRAGRPTRRRRRRLSRLTDSLAAALDGHRRDRARGEPRPGAHRT